MCVGDSVHAPNHQHTFANRAKIKLCGLACWAGLGWLGGLAGLGWLGWAGWLGWLGWVAGLAGRTGWLGWLGWLDWLGCRDGSIKAG